MTSKVKIPNYDASREKKGAGYEWFVTATLFLFSSEKNRYEGLTEDLHKTNIKNTNQE